MSSPAIIVWFRQDLRIADNPALWAACKSGPVIPIFIWAPEDEGQWPPGAASRWWLHQSLRALGSRLKECGSRLIIRRGNPLEQLTTLQRETDAQSIFWNRRYEPDAVLRDQTLTTRLENLELKVETFNSHLLVEPWAIANKSGKPFRVFTPFWKTALQSITLLASKPEPPKWNSPTTWPKSLSLDDLALLPKIDWAAAMRKAWRPGEAGAQAELIRFIDSKLAAYGAKRDFPGRQGTSRLSPHLHFGEIGPYQILQAIAARQRSWKNSPFVTELGWREFAHHLLFHFPNTPTEPLRSQFKQFVWHENGDWLTAWQKGKTGYPIVDAGMRELWATGWMHNRVRMIVASFLVKDLLQPWLAGAQWFWDTLVDADLANNTLGWQWCAGCGADAMPYFRIFNPVSQGKKFDVHGDYVRRWIPELAQMPKNWIHQPWRAPAQILQRAGVILGENYPHPIVSHAIAREVALEALRKIKS